MTLKPTMIILLLAVTATGAGIASVYADEFVMPFGASHLVDSWIEIIFNPVETGGVDVKVIQTSLFHYDNIIEMPDQFVVTHNKATGGVEKEIVVVKQIWENMIALPDPVLEQAITETPSEIKAKLEEERTELEEKFKKALFCKYGEGGSSVFQAKREVIILHQMDYFKQLPVNYQELRLILATEECQVFQESYLYKYAEYEDIALAQSTDIKPFVLDESDSPYTDPVTQRDLDDAAQRAADMPKKYNDPYKELSGENRGGYSTGKECQLRPVEPGITSNVMCPLQELQSYLTTTLTVEQNWTVIQQLVCDTYMGQYESIVNRIREGDSSAVLPDWLSHCLTTK